MPERRRRMTGNWVQRGQGRTSCDDDARDGDQRLTSRVAGGRRGRWTACWTSAFAASWSGRHSTRRRSALTGRSGRWRTSRWVPWSRCKRQALPLSLRWSSPRRCPLAPGHGDWFDPSSCGRIRRSSCSQRCPWFWWLPRERLPHWSPLTAARTSGYGRSSFAPISSSGRTRVPPCSILSPGSPGYMWPAHMLEHREWPGLGTGQRQRRGTWRHQRVHPGPVRFHSLVSRSPWLRHPSDSPVNQSAGFHWSQRHPRQPVLAPGFRKDLLQKKLKERERGESNIVIRKGKFITGFWTADSRQPLKKTRTATGAALVVRRMSSTFSPLLSSHWLSLTVQEGYVWQAGNLLRAERWVWSNEKKNR